MYNSVDYLMTLYRQTGSIMTNALESMWNETVVVKFDVMHRICMKAMTKITKIQGVLFSGLNDKGRPKAPTDNLPPLGHTPRVGGGLFKSE